jgi:hypothetical protein
MENNCSLDSVPKALVKESIYCPVMVEKALKRN